MRPTPYPAPGHVHFSNLRAMNLSAAHFQASITHPFKATPKMQHGTLVHTLTLGNGPDEPDALDSIEIWTGKSRQGKAWEEFRSGLADHVLTPTEKEYDRALAAAKAILADPRAREALEGEKEQAFEWSVMGRKCAGRLDVINRPKRRAVELKTTALAQPDWFVRHALKMHYHAQLAWYVDGLELEGATIIAAETRPPYAVEVFELTPRALEKGRMLVRKWMERLLICESSGEWPGYSQCVNELDVPDTLEDLVFPDDDEEEAAA